MKIVTGLLFILIAIWILNYVRKQVQSVNDIKETFKSGRTIDIIEEYDLKIQQLTNRLDNVRNVLDANDKLPKSHKQKKAKKQLEKDFLKLKQEQDYLIAKKDKFIVVANDYAENNGGIPSKEMQQHLKDYLTYRNKR